MLTTLVLICYFPPKAIWVASFHLCERGGRDGKTVYDGKGNRGLIDFEDAIDLIASGRVKTKPLITHKFSLKNIQKGIGVMEERKAIKVMIEP